MTPSMLAQLDHAAATPANDLLSHDDRHAYQAYRILLLGFIAAPLLAGLDKFTNLLAPWDQYLAPIVPRLTGLSAPGFMKIVGVIEVVAAIGVALKPRIFSTVVAAWLFGIIVNLLMVGQYFDVALRDLGLALGALALGRLSLDFDRPGRNP